MRFIKFNYNDDSDTVFTFCLDDVVTIDSDGGEDTVVKLRNGRREVIPIYVERFISEVFSDQSNNEYELIDVEGDSPEDRAAARVGVIG